MLIYKLYIIRISFKKKRKKLFPFKIFQHSWSIELHWFIFYSYHRGCVIYLGEQHVSKNTLTSVSLYDKLYPLLLQCPKGIFPVSFWKLEYIHVFYTLDSGIITCMDIIDWNCTFALRYISCIKERKLI